MTTPRSPERWPKVVAWAVFRADGPCGCELRVQVGGYARELCSHDAALRLSHIGTQEDALDAA